MSSFTLNCYDIDLLACITVWPLVELLYFLWPFPHQICREISSWWWYSMNIWINHYIQWCSDIVTTGHCRKICSMLSESASRMPHPFPVCKCVPVSAAAPEFIPESPPCPRGHPVNSPEIYALRRSHHLDSHRDKTTRTRLVLCIIRVSWNLELTCYF